MHAKTILAAGSVALAALVTFPAHADPDPPHGRCSWEQHAMRMHAPLGIGLAERMADRLQLSNEQIAALRAIEDKYRPAMRSALDQLRESRRALKQLDPSDAGMLRTIADTRGKAIADLTVMRVQIRSEVRAVLTEEQRQRLREMFRHGRHAQWQSEPMQGQGRERGALPAHEEDEEHEPS